MTKTKKTKEKAVKKAKPGKTKKIEKTEKIKKTKKVEKIEKKVAKPKAAKPEKADVPRDRKSKVKTIGLGIDAPEKKCEDYRCPWHGTLPVRGRAFKAIVKSSKSHATAVVDWDYHSYSTKYQRYERRKSRVVVHNPPCIKARDSDQVMIAECRPLSKTKHFVIVGIIRKEK